MTLRQGGKGVPRQEPDPPGLSKRSTSRLARAIRDLQDFKRALDEHALVAVTDLRGRITYANEKFCAISKYSREELLGQDHRILNSHFHSKAFMAELWRTILAGGVWKGEIKNRAKDGSCYWVESTIVPFLGADGRPEQFVAVRADITQRKESEEALRQSQKLESLGVLSGGIAHDFNNLLSIILGNSNIAAMHLPPESPAMPYLGQIEQATLRAADLTRQLLAYAGKGRFQVIEVDLNRLVVEMTQLLTVSLSKKAVVRYDLAPVLPLISADPSQMQQLVMNLITNASEAIGDETNGLITVRTGAETSQEPEAESGAAFVDRESFADQSDIERYRWNVRMTRSPGDPNQAPTGRPKPESFAPNCSADCASDSRGFESGTGGSAAPVEIHERNTRRRRVANPVGHRRFVDSLATG